MASLEANRKVLLETAAGIGLSSSALGPGDVDYLATNFSVSFDAGAGATSKDGASVSGAPSDDWGDDAPGSAKAHDDESLSLPGSFNDFKAHEFGDEDYASSSSYDYPNNGSSKQAPFNLADSGVPPGMVAQMQQQIARLMAETRSLDAKLSEERLSKAAAVAEARPTAK